MIRHNVDDMKCRHALAGFAGGTAVSCTVCDGGRCLTTRGAVLLALSAKLRIGR